MTKFDGKRKSQFRSTLFENNCSQASIKQKHRDKRSKFNFSASAELLRTIAFAAVLFVVVTVFVQMTFVQAAGVISGRVFQDFNSNGVYETTGGTIALPTAIDRGVAAVTVTAYDASGATQGTAATDANGQYTLNATGTGPYRVEFTAIPAGFQPSARSKSSVGGGTVANAGSLVQFVADGTVTNVNLALSRPEEYCQNNPSLLTCRIAEGAQNGTFAASPTILDFPYNAGTSFTDPVVANYDNPTLHSVRLRAGQIGTISSMVYRRSNKRVYAAAYFKKHAGFGPGADGTFNTADDPGAMYVINPSSSSVVTTFTVPNATINRHDVTNYGEDNLDIGWNAVGKTSLGGFALSDDETSLYVMNLENRRLYALNPNTGAVQQSIAVPTANIPIPNVARNCAAADVRPFAIKYYRSRIYVGMVCSAETTQNRADLAAYVYEVNPLNLAFGTTPLFSAALNYPRGFEGSFQATPVDWLPWIGTIRNTIVYPQPMLTEIEFDNGNLIMGIRDRSGDQGFDDGPELRRSAGDLLRACGNFGAWTLESNGRCGGTGTAPQGTGQGPGNGEFYFRDDFSIPANSASPHDEVAWGSILQIPGYRHVLSTLVDPIDRAISDEIFDGGVRWFNNTTGNAERAYRVYNDNTTDGDFGKVNGLGDLVAMCNAAPIEIGNRIWFDANANGVQDANATGAQTQEAGIAGVTVQLWQDTDGDGTADTQVNSTTTDANGEYYFTEASCPSSTVTSRISTSLDDAEQNNAGTVLTTGTSLDLAYGGTAQNIIGLRFNELDIPRNAVITSARLQFTTNTPTTSDAVNVAIQGEAADNAAPFTTAAFSVTNRAGTGARVLWSNIPDWLTANEAGANQLSPDVSSIIQQIVNRDGWVSGNSMVLAVFDNASTAGASRSAQAFDVNPANAPQLTVTYRTDCVRPNTKYEVRIPATNFTAGQPLNNRFLTLSNSSTTGSVDNNDSDAINSPNLIGVPSGSIPVVDFTTGVSGANNHNFDFGFTATPPASGIYSLGNRVWYDTNNDGRIETVEVGVSGTGANAVTVDLLADANADGTPDSATPLATVTTDTTGHYRFDNLGAGNYVVCLRGTNYANGLRGYRDTTGVSGSEIDSDTINAAENGIDTRVSSVAGTPCAGGTLSDTVSIGPGVSEPLGEVDAVAGGAVDGRANLTVDFGFFNLTLSGTIWRESDDDGFLEAGENFRYNARVLLFDAAGVEVPVGPDGILGTADDGPGAYFAGSNGNPPGFYSFKGLPPGDYKVRITNLAGMRSSRLNDSSTDPDNNTENDDSGVAITGTPQPAIESQFVTLTPGVVGTKPNNIVTNATGTTDDPTLDFGLFRAATAVTLQSFDATIYNNGVLLKWETGSEHSNIGFRVIREQNGKREQINREIIEGSALTAGANAAVNSTFEYQWFDENGSASAVYYLEDVDVNGKLSVSQVAAQNFAADKASPQVQNARLLGASNQVDGAQTEKPVSKVKVSAGKVAAGKAKSNVNPLANAEILKVRVAADGWHKVERNALLAAGLPENADLNTLQLFAENQEQAVRVNQDGSLEFYGAGLDTADTAERVYWLTWNQAAGKRINQNPVENDEAAKASSFASVIERRNRNLYIPAVLNGDRENFFSGYVWNNVLNQNVTLGKVAGGEASLEIDLQGFTQNNHRVAVKFNGETVGSAEFDATERKTFRFGISSSALREGANEVSLVEENGEGNISLLEALRITYNKRTTAENGSLQFVQTANQAVLVDGFASPTVRVLDVTNSQNTVEMQFEAVKSENGYAIQIPASRANRVLIAQDSTASHRMPTGAALNESSNLRGSTDGADFVILTHKDFRNAANRLAAARRATGLPTVVVNVEDVYDEFNFGAVSTNSIQEFLRGAVANWKAKPKYLLFFGDASADARNYLNFGANNFVPTKFVATETAETSSDDAMVDFNNDSIAEIAVGRLPVRTSAQAETVVSKLLAFENATVRGKSRRSALFVADTGFENTTAELAGALSNQMPVTTVNRQDGTAAEARERILSGINGGARIVTFTGHGSQRQWTNGGLLKSDDAATLRNGNQLSFFVNLTCLTGSFASPNSDSLSESLMNAENGGAWAVWASSGMTAEDEQKPLAATLFNNFGSFNGMRLGDVLLKAKQTSDNVDVRRTWTLFGDPTMRVR